MKSTHRTSGHSLVHICHHAVVAALLLCGLSVVGVMIAGSLTIVGRNIVLSIVLFTVLSFAAARCAHLYDMHIHQRFAQFGIGMCVIAFIAALIAVWDVFTSILVVHLAAIAVNIAIAIAHLCVMLPIRKEGPRHPMHVRIAASFTMASTIVCACLITLFFLTAPILSSDTYISLIVIMLALTLIGTLSTPILVRMHEHNKHSTKKS